MLLRELLDNVNKILEENMKKEVIRTSVYGKNYDEVNGRKVISDYFVKEMIFELSNINTWDILIDRAVNMSFWGIKFKLKRKKSDLLSSWDSTNRLTYVEINIEKEFEDKLDVELEILHQEYKDNLKKESESKKQLQLKNIAKFKSELTTYGINIKDFLDLKEKFDALSYHERKVLGEK